MTENRPKSANFSLIDGYKHFDPALALYNQLYVEYFIHYEMIQASGVKI